MTQKTLRQLREESYLKADLLKAEQTIPTELANTYINEAWCELYDLIVAMDDARIFATNATSPPKVGDYAFQLPGDFYHLCSCHIWRGSGYIPATAADPAQYPELAAATYLSRPQYYVRENPSDGSEHLFLFPSVVSEDVAICYFPEPVILENDEDSLTNKAARLEYVTLGAAIRMLSKIERDFTGLQAQQDRVAQRLMTALVNRDFNNPRRIRDISYRFDDF